MSPGIYGVVPIKTLLFTYVVLSRRSPRQEAHLSHEYKSLNRTDHYISYRCTVVTYNPKDMFKKKNRRQPTKKLQTWSLFCKFSSKNPAGLLISHCSAGTLNSRADVKNTINF